MVSADLEQGGAKRHHNRRSLIKKSLVAGTAVWIAPTVGNSAAGAAFSSCAVNGPVNVIAAAGNVPSPPLVCTEFAANTVTVCREPGQSVLLAQDAAATTAASFDELAIVEVTPPSGAANLVRWEIRDFQPDCMNARGPVSNTVLGGVVVDITAMFGLEAGDFSVRVGVWNRYAPASWSTVWVVPQP